MTFSIASISWANNWSWISKNVNDTDFYIDESTLKISGNNRKIWEMVDNPTVEGVRSSKEKI